MPFLDTNSLKLIERLRGWYGSYLNSASMTFAHYDFKRGSSIHEQPHPQEEVNEVLDGEQLVVLAMPPDTLSGMLVFKTRCSRKNVRTSV